MKIRENFSNSVREWKIIRGREAFNSCWRPKCSSCPYVIRSGQSASSYLLDLSWEALAANRHANEQLASIDSWQNNEYADRFLSIYHWLRLEYKRFGKMYERDTCVISDGVNKS